MDDVFLKLMDSAGVPEDARDATLGKLRALRTRYPGETPARLFARARSEGAAIPPSRCIHGVVRGECVTCDAKIGERFYYTTGGSHLHKKPTCEALKSGQDRGARWGGGSAPVEVVGSQADVADIHELCSHCFTTRAPRATATRRTSTPARSTSSPGRAVRIPATLPQGPKPLDAGAPPSVGDQIDWGGYSGVVTNVSDRGVGLDVGGITLTAPWGDRARIRRKPS